MEVGARKTPEHLKQCLNDSSVEGLEGYSVEINVGSGGLAHKASEQNKNSVWNRASNHVCNILATFNPWPEN